MERNGIDAFRVLGLSLDATEEQIRARYLELVKLNPPEKDAKKFQSIRHAFEQAQDPLVMAKALAEAPDAEDAPWKPVIEKHKMLKPKLSQSLLLSLGNKDPFPDSDQ